MIINKGDALLWAVASQNGDASKAESSGSKNFLGTIGPILRLLLLHLNKFCVDRNKSSGRR
jgi:hypothetical protein